MGEEKELRGLNPREKFYTGFFVHNLGGTVEFDTETPDGASASIEEVMERLSDSAYEHGYEEAYIYLCTPIKVMKRSRVNFRDFKVKDVKKGKP